MKPPIPEEEEKLIVDYIYTSFLIATLEYDYELVSKVTFKIPEAYKNLIECKLKVLRKDLVTINRRMRELKIRVGEPYYVNEDFVEYPYFPHGYEGRMRFWTAAMNLEGARRLNKLFRAPLD